MLPCQNFSSHVESLLKMFLATFESLVICFFEFSCSCFYVFELLYETYALCCCMLLETDFDLSFKESGTSCYLDKDESGIKVNQTMFRGMIGSWLYLTANRLDIMQFLCVCARFQANPKESHLTAVKRILKYLKGTACFGLWYPSGASPSLIGYSEADYSGCKVDRKSTSGTCHLLGSSLVSWHSKKQACVALPTIEAEYIAAGNCCAQILWMKQ